MHSNISKDLILLPFHVVKLPASSLDENLKEKYGTHIKFFYSKDHLNIDLKRFKNQHIFYFVPFYHRVVRYYADLGCRREVGIF